MTTFIKTAHGLFHAEFSECGLAGLNFPASENRAATLKASPPINSSQVARWTKLTQAAVEAMLAGRTPRALPPLDLKGATDFQQKVWAALSAIPCGQTLSYSEIARKIRHPKAARAVGQACGANPIPLLIPCHRALAANRKIGGFSCGIDWKKRLLEIERVEFS